MKTIKEGKNTNGVLDKVYIAYGSNAYSPEKFRPVDLSHWRNAVNNKPFGGLWASPIDSKWGWKDWCESEEWATDTLKKSFTFTIAPTAKIYVIDNGKDLLSVSTYQSEYIPSFSRTINFTQLIQDGYDGIFVTVNAIRAFRDAGPSGAEGLYTWDCESICIFNKEVIIPMEPKKNKMKQPKQEVIKVSESELKTLIENEIQEILKINEINDYVRYPKYRSPYDDKKI
jgi:hypothetical protein